jgi:MinD-like ATPase involved in chromosome partitioning or flagellar assembly
MDRNSRGQIITFYSYKGGTGRSMALANVACILANKQAESGGKGVLMIDWDLEAPGLHRYFRNRLVSNRLGIERRERPDWADPKPGLIDLFVSLAEETDRQTARMTDQQSGGKNSETVIRAEELARNTLDQIDFNQYILSTSITKLDLIKAGCFNPKEPTEYSQRVNKFNWEALYKKSPQLIRMFAESLARDYAYVLIDSRTGVTDISGVCTMILPEKLVVVFTPNLQSLSGAIDLIKQATDYRKESADLRALTVFPLVSRVEATEPELRHDWRFGTSELEGYQREFEELLREVYDKTTIKLDRYFDEMQIQHIPRYAYGEEIAVLVEKVTDAFSLSRRYQTFAKKLIEGRVPWEGEVEESTESSFSRGGPVILESLLDFFSLSGTTRSLRSLIVLFLLGTAVFAGVLSYSQFQKAHASSRALQQSQDDNGKLQKRVNELEDPIKGILKENNDRIADLTQQLSTVTQARDGSVIEAQAQKAAFDEAQQQLQKAAAVQKQLQAAQASERQALAQAAAGEAALNNTLAQYKKSQDEVHTLQLQMAKCNPAKR